jgi:hypothetical protein
VSIQGPGRQALTISGDADGNDVPDEAVDSRVFAIDVDDGTPVSISALTLAEGADSNNGGVIQSLGADLAISDTTITGGLSAGQGGGLHHEGRLTITRSTFADNSADNGGGLYSDDPGGSVLNGDVTITDSTFRGNEATDYNGGGAYIDQYGDKITVSGSTFSGNTADDDGGGINMYGARDGSFTLRNSTVSGNTAGAEGGGVKFGNYFDRPMRIENSTIVGNTAVNVGGGIFRYAGDDSPPEGTDEVTISSTIVADNSAPVGPDLGDRTSNPGTPIAESFVIGHSLIENVTGAVITQSPAGSNVLGADPQLRPLGDNGGPTQTLLPAPGSPVVDAGTANGLATDQRGFPRTSEIPGTANISDATDIGAVELRIANVTIDGAPKKRSKDSTPTFRFSGQDAASFECRIDKDEFAACTSPFTASKLESGKHRFEVRAVSPDGAAGPVASHSFTVTGKVKGAKVAAKGTQAQSGKVKVKIKVSAKEAAKVAVKGTVTADGEKVALKKAKGNVKPGKAKTLTLKPKSRGGAETIFDALEEGEKVIAKIKAKFTGKSGSKATKGKTIRLK